MDWLLWALILVVQNFAFTFVSRARNSGHLVRHMQAAIFSNGVWFASQILIFSKLYDYITGKAGLQMAIFTGVFYTVFTVLGSIVAHYWALKTEKGKSAVGANKKYAQIPVEDWEFVREFVRAREVF